ncbi:MAG: DEAD/DEAH box helicase [Chitinophagaceae bacterium]
MEKVSAEQKTVVLLAPHRLLLDHLPLIALQINKTAININYSEKEFSHSLLRDNLNYIPKEAKSVLSWFSKSGIGTISSEIKTKFTLNKAGLPYQQYFKSAMLTRLHDLFNQLKPFSSQIKFYHQQEIAKGRYKTSPCTFNKEKPFVKFEVRKENDSLQLKTLLVINDETLPLTDFVRHHFLLCRNNEYFLLGYKDYQTLEWLQQSAPEQYSNQSTLLAENILVRLEKDYTVLRNNLFDKTAIVAEPVNRLMLSEISQQFLMLTPQWNYDGIIIEGVWKPTFDFTSNGEQFTVERNKEKETAFVQLLESLHANFRKQLNGYFYLSFADAQKAQWFLKVYHRLLEMNVEITGMDMLQHFRYSSEKIQTQVTITEEGKHILQLQVKLSFGKEKLLLTEIQKTIRAGQRSVLLKDGSIGVLDDEWLQRYGSILRHGKITGADSMELSRWMAHAEQHAAKEEEVLKIAIKQDWWQKWYQWQKNSEPVYQLPLEVKATLRPYQQKGFEWMLLLAEAGAGACLADDMGLGKTLQTVCFLAYQLQQNPQAVHLVVAPSSLIYNWQRELQKFAPHINVVLYHGQGRGNIEELASNGTIVITSYGTVRSEAERFQALSFATVVLDESHNIKNPSSQITKVVNTLNAATRIALSGTPLMNNTFDLYAQFNFLLPGMFGSREFFKREYADAIDRDRDPARIQALKKLTDTFILRRTKEQVEKDLPEKTEMVLWCNMGAAQKTMYDEIRDSIKNNIFLDIKTNGLAKSKLAVLQGIIKLRQACNSSLLLPEGEQSCTDSVKTDVLLDELSNNLKDKKVLVFSQFTGMLNILAKTLTAQGIAFYHFDGSTPPAKRMEMVNAFQEEGNNVPVFLISLKAGNAGLNLTAANYVFLFDPWWNTAVQQQAIDRTHRIGQTKSVFAYKMICRDTIEEKIIALQEKKQQLADELIGEDEGFVKALTEDDIAYLFS